MRLLSDFYDFYDHAFDGSFMDTPVFERFSYAGPTRREMFAMFVGQGIPTPVHGLGRDVRQRIGPNNTMVVYTDELAHRGEGKVLFSTNDHAADGYFASAFINDGLALPTSIRYLYVGNYAWAIRYTSHGGTWQSNVGKVVQIEREQTPTWPRSFAFPLYAIDTVGGYAVDLNIAPELRGTPVQDDLSPYDVVNAITSYIEERIPL